MRKILIVEDEKAVRDLLRRHLRGSYEIVETGDPTKALALALEKKPDCILLDLNLPNFSGLELCTIFSDLNVTQLIPVIIITGDPTARYEEISKILRVAGFMRKPLNFEELKKCIASVLEGKQAERRREARVKLNVSLRLSGHDSSGNSIDLLVVTDDVSANGFSCSCSAALHIASLVSVAITSGKERMVGRARIIRVEHRDTPRQKYGFLFVEKTKEWILQ